MPEFVRVRDHDTQHEYTVVASAVDPEAQTVLDKEPAVDEIGVPLPPKHHTPKTAPESLSSNAQSGPQAVTKKES